MGSRPRASLELRCRSRRPTREALQAHFGAASLQPDPNAYLEKDFSALIETVALAAGMKLKSENKTVASGLETKE